MADRGEKRNKRKEKLKEKKKHPYKSGGIFRTGEIELRVSEKSKKKKN
ncbi:MAG: hypothetical protein NUV46_02145 [Nanoarchaeota archaeon]|nr:hypothetical protein [Nanoarchaeota archaeon]